VLTLIVPHDLKTIFEQELESCACADELNTPTAKATAAAKYSNTETTGQKPSLFEAVAPCRGIKPSLAIEKNRAGALWSRAS
jgi:hypothetical protein